MITSVKKLFKGRTGRSGFASHKYSSQYVDNFHAYSDTASDNAATVLLSPLLPALFSPYSGDPFALLVGADADQIDETQFIWLVRCNYDSNFDPRRSEINPLKRPPQLDFGYAAHQKVAEYDIYGKPLVNVVGQQFNPPLEQDDSRLVLRYVRNEASYNPASAAFYKDTTNNDSFLGCNPGLAKCAGFPGSYQYENGVYFWRVSYEFHFRSGAVGPNGQKDDWTRYVLNQGTKFLNDADKIGADGKCDTTKLKENKGKEPVNLKKDGTIAAKLPDDTYFVPFTTYRQVSFAPLNIILP